MSVRPTFALAILGSSLSTGRLSADWPARLAEILPQQPEARGPISIFNMGKGSQTSDWGVTRAPDISVLRPSHILMEGFAINDSVDFGSGPAVTRANHIINIQTMVAEFKSKRSDVDITIQTMNPADAALRPNLADYYSDELAVAALLGVRSLDNYLGWPKPLPQAISNQGDKLHPLWNTPTPSEYMTAALLPSGNTASASGELDAAHAAWTAFDGPGSTANYWCSASAAFPQYLRRQWTSAKTWTSYSIRGVALADVTRNPRSWTLRGSNDGSSWTTLDTRTLEPLWSGDAEVRSYTITAPGAYTYYELNVTANQGGAYVGVNELTFFGSPILGGVDTYLFPNALAWARARMAAYWP